MLGGRSGRGPARKSGPGMGLSLDTRSVPGGWEDEKEH